MSATPETVPQIEVVPGLHKLRATHRGCALTIGKFDGVHLGHQALLTQTCRLADKHGVPATVMSFCPSPREFFSGGEALPAIGQLRDKLDALCRFGIRRLIIVRFNQELAQCGHEAFLSEVLIDRLGAKALIVGDDLRFGRNREGDVQFLRERASKFGYEVAQVESVQVQGERCSSSRLRNILAKPDLEMAESLLGRPYRLIGRVRKGLQLGRTLDMPTANIAITSKLALPLGVFAVRARCGEQQYKGVASLGIRPTLNLTQCLLETHLFDVSVDLYGKLLEVEFAAFLRPEQKFEGLDALKVQMHRDAEQARAILDDSAVQDIR